MKTNACRVLEKHGADYELIAYAGDPTEMDPPTLAAAIGHPAEQIFKTLVVEGDKTGIFIAVISIAESIDLRALARATKNKKVQLAPIPRLRALTGYVRGAVTALATTRPWPVWLEEKAILYDRIGVSAGEKGLELWLDPEVYIRVLDAKTAEFGVPI